MPIATISQAITRGNISIYLSGNDNAKGALFSPRRASPGSPVTIAMVTYALTWGYSGGAQTDQDLRQMANYLIWLIGFYGQQAQAISEGSGGGSVIPGGGQTTPEPLNFIVDPTSPIPAGSNSISLPTFIGFNLQFTRGGIVQSTVSTETSYYSWNKGAGLFICFPDAIETELFILMPT